MRSMRLVLLLACAGCGSIEYDTTATLEPSGLLRRRTTVAVDRHPMVELPRESGWKLVRLDSSARTSTTVELSGELPPSERPVPAEMRHADNLGRPAIHHLERRTIDLGLLQIHRYRETIGDSVDPSTRQNALLAAYALGRDLLFEWTERTYGEELELRACRELVEQTLDPLVVELIGALATLDPLDWRLESCRRVSAWGLDYCAQVDEDARKAAVQKFLDGKLSCARPKAVTAKPLDFARLEADLDRKGKGSFEELVAERFGSIDAFSASAKRSMVDLLGAHGGLVFGGNWRWRTKLQMPGRIFHTNGAFDGRTVYWRFDATQFYGHPMTLEASSLSLAVPFAGRESKIPPSAALGLIDNLWLLSAQANAPALERVRAAGASCAKGDPRPLAELAQSSGVSSPAKIARMLEAITAELAPACK